MNCLNPTQRWRQLRGSACIIESLIWRYRTRTKEFVMSAVNAKAPEDAFYQELATWREELVAGSDLQHTTLYQRYGEKLFKHG
eukprot:CAMPEP_0195139054 /NCGR_PEP_ID=MMETSP0448-20130528/158690_1 /TAXON_ID=66468 /ORGANISM="Heterocapsa triquestra, Strain CCMP 448" /LENGTH=82 /DNA_ID=CAMNT_0040177351 /DNA_START=102 /DNA_END=346 /DNA_ORIENTATION=+